MRLYLTKILISFYVFILKTKNSKKTSNRSVVFFNTHDRGGGAAKICFQLFNATTNAVFFVKEKRTSLDKVFEFEPDLWNRLGEYARGIERKQGIIDFGKIGLLKLMYNKYFKESSVVHLHNSHGYYLSFFAIQQVFRSKKVIWTLHDDYLLTGHCSFSMECDKWLLGCNKCPDLSIYPALQSDTTKMNQDEKLKCLLKIQPYIITPSKWLFEKVKTKYPFLKNVGLIYNGVDIDVFKPLNNTINIKQKYNIPVDKKVVLFVAELSLKNPFKGGDILLEIMENFKLDSSFVFLTVGGLDYNSNQIISLPYIQDDFSLSELYNAADVMLYPTKADNLPLVILESMACGTPVIASDIAGIPEIIDHKEDGYLIEKNNIREFINTINYYFDLPLTLRKQVSELARKKVTTKFSLKDMIKGYDSIYKLLGCVIVFQNLIE